jgi:excisionase family DNA binding protein
MIDLWRDAATVRQPFEAEFDCFDDTQRRIARRGRRRLRLERRRRRHDRLADMDKDILTTTETAKLLGVSVRTAQLLIEGGALTSWKTPGGHRRVYHSDVLAFMARKSTAPAVPSARVLLLASAERLPALEKSVAAVGGCSIDAYTTPFAASFSMGSRTPAALVVDVDEETSERVSFLESVALNPALGHTKLIALGGLPPEARDLISSRLHANVTSPQALADAVRTALQDAGEVKPFSIDPSIPVAINEGGRLAALQRSGLLEAGTEETFDQITWLASRSLRAPVALVTMLTATHQFFKSRHGLALTETPRSWAFCNYTILQRGVMEAGDLARDERFAANPAVMNDPHFRFYAGAPVVDPDGFALASLCVIDYEPRTLDRDQQQTLQLLAKFASGEVRLRAANRSMPGASSA